MPEPDERSRAIIDGLEAIDPRYVLHLPSSTLTHIINYVLARPNTTAFPIPREEEGVGILAGLELAGDDAHRRPGRHRRGVPRSADRGERGGGDPRDGGGGRVQAEPLAHPGLDGAAAGDRAGAGDGAGRLDVREGGHDRGRRRPL